MTGYEQKNNDVAPTNDDESLHFTQHRGILTKQPAGLYEQRVTNLDLRAGVKDTKLVCGLRTFFFSFF